MKKNKFLQIFCSGLLTLLLFFPALAQKPTIERDNGGITVETLAEGLDHPWAVTFLPDNRMLVTERAGTLRILDTAEGLSDPIQGTPEVFAVGQGGMLDVALDPNFDQNKYVYLSFSEPGGDSTATTALGRGIFDENKLNNFEVIFRMEPMLEGPNHFGGRIIFTEEGDIFLTLAERFKGDPAQDLTNHLGTIVKLNKDGSAHSGNPFTGRSDARDEIWSYGHRNIEAAAIDTRTGKLWIAEMGPMGGDEFNQPKAGENYGWPEVSWGRHYDGESIPEPTTRPEFADAEIVWTPTISPSGMIFYNGDMFPEWQDHALIGGLTSTGIVVVQVENESAEEVERVPLGVRTRDVVQAPDGSLIVVTDEDNGKVLRLKKME